MIFIVLVYLRLNAEGLFVLRSLFPHLRDLELGIGDLDVSYPPTHSNFINRGAEHPSNIPTRSHKNYTHLQVYIHRGFL